MAYVALQLVDLCVIQEFLSYLINIGCTILYAQHSKK
jgi:hypothetical protein